AAPLEGGNPGTLRRTEAAPDDLGRAWRSVGAVEEQLPVRIRSEAAGRAQAATTRSRRQGRRLEGERKGSARERHAHRQQGDVPMEEEVRRALLAAGFAPEQIYLEQTQSGNVGGYVVSPRFVGHSQLSRQDELWRELRAHLAPEHLRRIVSI